MGSFINQCFATRQTVMEGAPCRVILLRQTRQYHPTSCSLPSKLGDAPQVLYGAGWSAGLSQSWAPLMGFLKAKAGDRADFLLEHDGHTALQQRNLMRILAAWGAVASNAGSTDESFDFAQLCKADAPALWTALTTANRGSPAPDDSQEELDRLWASLAEPLLRMQVFVPDYGQVFRNLSLGVIHEEAYQWLLKEGENAEVGYARRDYLRAALVEALNYLSDDKELSTKPDDAQRVIKEMVLGDALRSALRRISGDCFGSSHFWFKQTSALVRAHLDKPEALLTALLEQLNGYLDDSYVMKGLAQVNVPFVPLTYAGQDYDNECGKRYLALVQSTCQAVNELRKQDFE